MASEVIKPHVSGLYEYTFTNDKGVEETKLITLSEAILKVGIWSVAAQDDVLSALADQMSDQTKSLEDINEIMGILDIFKRGWQDYYGGQEAKDRTVPFLPEERQKIEQALAAHNAKHGTTHTLKNPVTSGELDRIVTVLQADKDNARSALAKELIALNIGNVSNRDSLTDEQARKIIESLEGKEVDMRLRNAIDEYLTAADNCDTLINCRSCTHTNTLSIESQNLLKELVAKCGLSLGTVDISKKLTLENIDELLKNLSTVQSSQGAVNEDLSLRLNQAASERSAIFSQLQTLLQTLMQTIRQLSNW